MKRQAAATAIDVAEGSVPVPGCGNVPASAASAQPPLPACASGALLTEPGFATVVEREPLSGRSELSDVNKEVVAAPHRRGSREL